MGLKMTCDGCGRVVVGVFSSLQNVNGRYLCKACVSSPHSIRYYCNSCGNYSLTPSRRGSGWIELILYLCVIIPGLIYSIWRRSGSPNVCPVCRSSGLVPARFAKKHDEEERPLTKKCPACAEEIKVEATKCRFCGERFDPGDVTRQVAEARNEVNFEDRVLCSDGNCVGVIGPNGRCNVCGKAAG